MIKLKNFFKQTKEYFYSITALNKFLFLFSISVILLLLSFSFFTFPWGDDFAWFRGIKEFGPLKYSIRQYFNFEGRFLSIQSLFRTYLFYIFFNNIKPIIFIWILAFIFAAVFIKKTLFEEIGIYIKSSYLNYFASITVIIIIFLSLHKSLGFITFWGTGGTYSLVMMFIFAEFYLLEKYKREDNIKQKLLLAFFAFSIGNGGFYVNVAFITYLFFYFLEIIAYKKINIRKIFNILFSVVFPFIIGAYYILVAPGNTKRIEKMHYTITFNLYDLLHNLIKILDMFSIFYLSGILLGGVLLFLLLKFFENEKEKENIFFTILRLIKWPIVGTFSILSFIPIEKAAGLHTGYLFAIGWMFFIAKFLVLVSNLLKIKFNKAYFDYFIYFILLIGFFRVSVDVYKQYDFYSTEFKNYETQIKEHRFHALEVCPYNLEKGAFFYRKVRYNEKNWLNRAVSNYYGLKSIKLKKCYLKYRDYTLKREVGYFYVKYTHKIKKYKKWLKKIDLKNFF